MFVAIRVIPPCRWLRPFLSRRAALAAFLVVAACRGGYGDIVLDCTGDTTDDRGGGPAFEVLRLQNGLEGGSVNWDGIGDVVTRAAQEGREGDPLPSWNDGQVKAAIIQFVDRVSDENSPDFVPTPKRIAVFDNDGTLWSEQPAYFQLLFVFDRVKAMAPEHPEWKAEEPFASVLKGDMKGVAASGKKGLMRLLAATHAGMTIDEFEKAASDWIETARHPTTGKPYTEMVYQPMLELLDYLRAKGFKTFIVSGGGIEFMRPWTEKTYGIPPEQVVGSSLKMKYELRDGKPVLVKLAEIDLVDDKAGKPVGIQSHIGRRPIFAAGNSDGDYEMLRWTTAGAGPRFGLIVHHTDAAREFSYDRDSPFGRLDKALDEATQRGWVVIDMKKDWGLIYPGAERSPHRRQP